jgi:site-specific recombinase XerD
MRGHQNLYGKTLDGEMPELKRRRSFKVGDGQPGATINRTQVPRDGSGAGEIVERFTDHMPPLHSVGERGMRCGCDGYGEVKGFAGTRIAQLKREPGASTPRVESQNDMPEIPLSLLKDAYLLSHETEWTSRNTSMYYSGILRRFLWFSQQNGWPDDAALITEWNVREFLRYVGREENRWAAMGNGSESSSRRASPRTVHHYYRALTAFFNWALREGYLAESPMVNIKVAKPKRKVIRPYTPEQVERILAVCARDYKRRSWLTGSRNYAIIMLLFDSGLRLSELVAIKLRDIDKESGWIRVTGKGTKERMVRMGYASQKALRRYLDQRPGSGSGALWLTREGSPLTASGLQSAFRRLKQRAGIEEEGGCHRLRHTFALSFLRSDRNPFNLQYLLGHNSLDMVRHYTATMGMEDALEAHVKASPADHLTARLSTESIDE